MKNEEITQREATRRGYGSDTTLRNYHEKGLLPRKVLNKPTYLYKVKDLEKLKKLRNK